ncbi:MAG: hypothetical protein OEY66_00835 [Gammaproteobacteria bacterium]|nr:hypothetical protein [Gammaproteobacteria bacterium]
MSKAVQSQCNHSTLFTVFIINGNGIFQIYLKDMNNESVTMISRNTSNVAGNAPSTNPDMSPDGKHIVFEPAATNFTSSNGLKHIYYVDTSVAHAVEQISLSTTGAQASSPSNNPSISNDGSMIAFDTGAALNNTLDKNGVLDVYLRDRTLSLTSLISANPNTSNSGNNISEQAHISGNADYVVFESVASDLVNNDTLGFRDIFVRDLSALPAIIIDRVNVPTSGSEATASSNQPAISTDGRYISFHSTVKFTNDDIDTISDVFRAHNSTHP